jgi:hypothetical protein
MYAHPRTPHLSLRVVRRQVEGLPLHCGAAIAQLLLNVQELEVRRHEVDVHGLHLQYSSQKCVIAHKVYTYIHLTHKYIHTYIHTYIIHIILYYYNTSYIHTYIHTCRHTYMQTYIHTYIHTYNVIHATKTTKNKGNHSIMFAHH